MIGHFVIDKCDCTVCLIPNHIYEEIPSQLKFLIWLSHSNATFFSFKTTVKIKDVTSTSSGCKLLKSVCQLHKTICQPMNSNVM